MTKMMGYCGEQGAKSVFRRPNLSAHKVPRGAAYALVRMHKHGDS
jgi:hypothetical protein